MQHQMAQPDELKCVTSHTINGEQDDSGANTSQNRICHMSKDTASSQPLCKSQVEGQKTSRHLGGTAGFENGQLSLPQ